ncbi:MAG: hypothetical protein IPJ84_09590 [Bdellovibrionales bacterium]|nr:hypothetical protein [Bdellovibrionales bacterium]
MKGLASGTPEHSALSSTIRLQEETISHVNDILRVQRGDSTINLTNINTILEKSQLVENQIDAKLLNRLLYEIKGEIKNGDIEKAVTVWTEKSLKKNPSLQKSDFDNAMGCLTKVAK